MNKKKGVYVRCRAVCMQQRSGKSLLLIGAEVNEKQALSCLNALLPLAERQAALDAPLRRLHRAILKLFAELGRAPRSDELAARTRIKEVHAALERLRDSDLIVLNRDGEVAGAYPFSAEDTPHRVMMDGREVRAMCAVDALAISPMFHRLTVIESHCHVLGQAIRLYQNGASINPQRSSPGVCVGIGWRSPGCCAAHSLCREMVFFASRALALEWQGGQADIRSVFSLDEAIQLGMAFFLPLLEESAN